MRFKVQRCPGLVIQKVDTLVPRKLVSLRHRDAATRNGFRNPMRQPLQQRALGKQSKQLRILFCGSDEFSSASLRALHDLQQRKPGLVKSIDVMIRPGKPSGRSMKTIRDVPIKAVAQELGLRIHERDTFTGWEPPLSDGRPINLIVAVSFGLFVPPRILKAATYGGLNVHPSLLPNLRGPAPIHHTILTGQEYTGVTVQTLHEKTFDHGLILAQGPRQRLKVTEDMNYADLHNALTPIGASLLADSIERCLHVPPLRDVGKYDQHKSDVQHAPKITPADRKINFKKRSKIMNQHRALGRLWTDLYIDETTTKRCVFEDFEEVSVPFPREEDPIVRPLVSKDSNIILSSTGVPPKLGFRVMVQPTPEGDKAPLFYIESGESILISYVPKTKGEGPAIPRTLRVTKITVAGDSSKPAAVVLRGLQRKGKWVIGPQRDEKVTEQTPQSLWKSVVKAFSPSSEVPEDTRKYLHYPFSPVKRKDGSKVAPTRHEKANDIVAAKPED